MYMKTRMKVEKPEDVEVTMTITMRAKQWEELRDELSERYPASELSRRINDLLSQTRRILWSDPDTDPK